MSDSPAAPSGGLIAPASEFERARRSLPGAERVLDLTLAGAMVRMRVVGDRLSDDLARAFAPALAGSTRAGPADLEIELWDEEETGVAWPWSAPQDDGATAWHWGEDLVSTSPEQQLISVEGPRWRARFDREGGRLVGAVASAVRQSLVERGQPLDLPLFLWHFDHGAQVIHASLVSREGRGILLVGPMGAGKTSAALACIEAGYEFLGDDHVALVEDGQRIAGHGIYGVARLWPTDLPRFGALEAAAIRPSTNQGTRKVLILLADLPGVRFAPAAEIRALVLPRPAGGSRSGLQAASPADALKAVAPMSILQLPVEPVARGIERLTRLAERVPAFWLDMGDDPASTASAVDEVLAVAGP